MSIYGLMRTGVSGMNAQSSKLAMVADNIANADSTGYKRASAEFSSLVLNSNYGQYQSGGVLVHGRQHVSEQGTLRYSTSSTDLAITGNGFFAVEDANGRVFLTRAGSFVADANGDLINSAGYKLLGHPKGTENASLIANGFDGLDVINVNNRTLLAQASTAGALNANLPASATVIAPANLPSGNLAGSVFSAKTSMIAYDSLGGEVTLDIYFAKTSANTWEAATFDRAGATNGGFPYSSAALSTATVSFDPANGRLTAASANALSVAVPGGKTLDIDLAKLTQLSTGFAVIEAQVDGNSPSVVDGVEISANGAVMGILRNGTRAEIAQIAIADVPSADRMTREAGNAFSISEASGDVRIGVAQAGGFGSIIGGALEESTVDIATELTEMIQSQRTYTANSKVFMTGA
ncbi:MAG: flagellar hook protein FlgE, partial [Notoacmeibacter sp.]